MTGHIRRSPVLFSMSFARHTALSSRCGAASAFRLSTNTFQSRRNPYSTTASDQHSLVKAVDKPAPHTGHIRVITLNRPNARNAISRQLLAELSQQIESIHDEGESGTTRAVVLASESDDCFCAGADLKERRGMSFEETTAFLASLRQTFKRLASLPIPTISAVSSVALGGGLELALCTHLRVFASTAVVGLPETRLAIIPGAGGTYRLPAVIGTSAAREMILTGRRVGALEARSLQLCNRLVLMEGEPGTNSEGSPKNETLMTRAREAALEEALKLATEICEGGPIAIRAVVQALSNGGNESAENAAYDTILHTSDRTEALNAFREKRKPKYAGK